MIYDLSQPVFTNVPQWPAYRPTSLTGSYLGAAADATNADDVESATVVSMNGLLHFDAESNTPVALPFDHFHAPCIAIDLRYKAPESGIYQADLSPFANQLQKGRIVLLKTGWGDKRGLIGEHQTSCPYLTGEGARYLIGLGVHGVGIEGLGIAGFNNLEKESEAYKALLGAKILIVEDIRIPVEMLDGRIRDFAAFSCLFEKSSGAWARAFAWDERDLA